jgi:hypothetical protein
MKHPHSVHFERGEGEKEEGRRIKNYSHLQCLLFCVRYRVIPTILVASPMHMFHILAVASGEVRSLCLLW